MPVIIRPIEAKDNAALAKIIRDSLTEFNAAKPGTVFFDASTDHLSDLFKAPGSAYFVAEEEEQLLGGAGLFPTEALPPGTAELVKMYLKPAARGKGIGKMLMDKNIGEALRLGYDQLYLETMPELKIAIRSYERAGFEYLDGAMGNSQHTGCSIWMKKKIGPVSDHQALTAVTS